jgi:hypothetical protein
MLKVVIDSNVFVVTVDKDLLSLNPFKNIQIITPSEFLKKLK